MEWEGSSNGPGWQDVVDLMTALDGLHGCTTTVQLNSGAWYGVGRLCAAVVSMRPQLGAPENLLTCTTVLYYPTKGHKTVSGWLFGGLHEHDKRISREWYANLPLPLEE